MKLHKPRTYIRLAKRAIFPKASPVIEPLVKNRLKNIHGSLFVDIGANIGHYTFLLAPNFNFIYAFEPHAEYYATLAKKINWRYDNRITAYEMALSNRDGETLFYTNPFAKAMGSACTILPAFEYKPDVDPDQRPPDQIFYGHNGRMVKTAKYDSVVKRPADLVKIDVEGAEFLVLEGMMQSIDTGKVKRICVELHNRDRKKELSSILSDYRQEWLDRSHLLASLI